MEVIVTIVSKLVYFTLRDLHPTYIRVIIHLLSTMDIPVRGNHLFGLSENKTNIWRFKAFHLVLRDQQNGRLNICSVSGCFQK